MKRVLLILAAFCTLAVTSAKAAVIVLGFEGLKDLEPVNEFYNGGTGGFGSGGGTNYHISFGSDSLSVIEDEFGGSGNFAGEPSPPNIVFFLGTAVIMNVHDGFDTGFSFFYSAVFFPGTVKVWSGENATGTLLASLDLPLTPHGPCPEDPDADFCPFVPFGVAFNGIAHSVDFSGTANQIGFDDITLGSSTPGVPEPASLLLLGTGLVGIARKLRKKV